MMPLLTRDYWYVLGAVLVSWIFVDRFVQDFNLPRKFALSDCIFLLLRNYISGIQWYVSLP
jgi:hypothetical protein